MDVMLNAGPARVCPAPVYPLGSSAGGTTVPQGTILNQISDVVIQVNSDGRVTFWNTAAERLYGATAEQMVGQDLRQGYDCRWADAESQRTAEAELAASGEWRGENTHIKRGGGTLHVESSVSVFRDEAGQAQGRVIVSRPVSERTRAERQLKEAKEAAEAANRAKDEFLAVLSHELRTPLTPVLLTASLLEHRTDLPPEVLHDIQVIRRNVQLESRIIDDLLDLTRISRGRLHFDFQTSDVHLLIRNAASICAGEPGAKIDLQLQSRQQETHGDPVRLQQVFWNLLNNARKFTPRDGTITVRTKTVGGGRIRIDVRDTGAGIEAEVLPRIFTAFEQGDPIRARQLGGLGLGLAISKAITEAHGGTIAVASEGPGKGATFTVELPVLTTTSNGEHEAMLPFNQKPPLRRLRVLLVDDHGSTLAVMRRLVGGFGHEVHSAGSVAEALQLAETIQFDLLISDLGLPDGSGHDLMRQLGTRQGLKGIALSGYGMEHDLKRSAEAGFLDHLTKPVDIAKLEDAIRRAMKS